MRHAILLLTLFTLVACDDFEPREKRAVYDPQADALVLPYPCPDWSKNAVMNNSNSVHSNFGCAAETDSAIQIENPHDLLRGHGASSPDTEITTHVIESYRKGEIPVPLVPQQQDTSQ